MVKLIITDIDDTLVPSGSTELQEGYFEVFEELINKGIRVVVASGRHMISVSKTFAPIMDKIDVISQGGNVIRLDGKEEVVRIIPTEWVRGIWKDVSEYQDIQAEVAILTATECFVPYLGTPMSDLLINSYKYELTPLNSWDEIPDKQYSMITTYHPRDIMTLLNNTPIRDKWSGKLKFSVSGQTWTDIHLDGSDKGSSMLRICEKLGIDPADTIAFGDNDNDITMIRNAGIGYAVSNARPGLKAVADRVIPGYEENGVLKELRKIAAEL